ncbi:hypothetical protein BDZ89DRAFT_1141824 [Hymenopellis radicata]|nr:hypothetical protein BDZ89DRAFT_1141824 [Hymenopellis radicata]
MCLGLQDLPVELLYLIQLLALSEHLPSTCRHLTNRNTLLGGSSRTPSTDHPIYIPRLYATASAHPQSSTSYAPAVRLPPTCTKPSSFPSTSLRPGLAEPLSFLRVIEANAAISPLNVNAHSGFALTIAVYASFVSLIRYLLESGANPAAKEAIALIYGRPKPPPNMRPMPDRIRCNEDPEFLTVAMKVDATDIANYLREKGCVPDLGVIKWLLSAYPDAYRRNA